MCKWRWKLETESGPWQELIQKKYLKGQDIFNIQHKPNDSPCWADLLKVRDLYVKGRCVVIGDGKSTDLWGDAWCGQVSFAQQFPRLFSISNEVVGLAAICWAIWKLRNRACFEKKLIRSPAEIICLACAFMKYWPWLQSNGDEARLRAGAEALQAEALRLHPQQARMDMA
ncbi:hypothetical protein BRADI_1g28723v3 [Brachypodium distachyon]|uniref:Reverse transcriptase zinc-binding domain-containing protein n=1 Tax=Brachypodium distachyon TaxID=15368 RepID=A0A2K2DLQ6_BRADI|nr:hypothetical protein BRADI_1g28723v3 [Brachypodium distachyon]